MATNEIAVQKGNGSYVLEADSQGVNGKNVTKSDSVTYRPTTFYVGTGGDLTVKNVDGTTCIYKNFPSGCFCSDIIIGIMSTGTTASDFIVYNQG